MTYQELLSSLQQMSKEQLLQDVIVFDIHKGEGYDDIVLENNQLTFGQD
jgi:hypothetical protein